jgi:hypothetical protein
MLSQHKLNGRVILAEGSSKLTQGLPCLPAPLHVVPLLLRKLAPSAKCHKHHLIEKRFISNGVALPIETAVS